MIKYYSPSNLWVTIINVTKETKGKKQFTEMVIWEKLKLK